MTATQPPRGPRHSVYAAKWRATSNSPRPVGFEPPEYAHITKGLKAAIAAAEARAAENSIPPVLRGRIGKHAARDWAALADNLPVKREIIREILSIGLLKADPDHRAFGPHRLNLAWTYGEPPSAAPAPRSAGKDAE
jgi:hypothetical protein